VLLLGDGKLAQLIARVLSRYSNHLTVVGKHLPKIKLLKQHKIRVYPQDDFKAEPGSYQVVIEATGNWEGWELALQMVMSRGFLVLKSTYAGDHTFNPAPLVIKEITLIGSRCGPFPKAIQLLRENAVDPTDLITKVYPFSEWEQAIERAQHPDTLKILLEH
jgi:threonine dehydrogenase-like Zn-dependent dehydrogenase